MLTTIYTKPGPLLRLRLAVKAWYLRRLIDSAQVDIDYHDMCAQQSPQLADIARRYQSELRVRLIDCETRGRP